MSKDMYRWEEKWLRMACMGSVMESSQLENTGNCLCVTVVDTDRACSWQIHCHKLLQRARECFVDSESVYVAALGFKLT